jgi:hypothetical protein
MRLRPSAVAAYPVRVVVPSNAEAAIKDLISF